MAKKEDNSKKANEEEKTQAQLKMEALKKSLQKEVGKEVIYKDHEDESGRIELGAIGIDNAFGGGIPKGRIVELYGWESSGKTTIALMYMKKYLDEKEDNIALYIDAEYAHDKEYMESLGIDLDRVIIVTPATIEDTFKSILSASKVQAGYVLVDSVAAMMSVQEQEKGLDGNTIGSGARVMGIGLKNVVGEVRRNNIACVMLNQIREKIGVMFGDPRTTPGGNAMKFYASLRAEIKSKRTKSAIDTDKETGDAVSNTASLYVTKNKTAPPFREAEYDMYYGEGIDIESHNIKIAIKEGIIEKGGAWFTIPLSNGETERVQGEKNVLEFYKDKKNKKEYQYLYNATKEQFNY